jgi:soluble lytic murein transglycosylase-like protein
VYHPEISDAQALDPTFSVDWMGQYLGGLIAKHGGDVYSALREYNGGPDFSSNRIGYLGRTVNELTKTHADAVMAHAARAVVA